MSGNTAIEIVGDRKFYDDTPYYSVDININTLNHIIPITLVVNSNTKYVNLSKIFADLQKGVNAKYKMFHDYCYLRSSLLFTDIYSLEKYGHVHYKYDNKNLYCIEDKELIKTDHTNLNINNDIINKGKIVKTKLINEVPDEIFGENYNGIYNECKGRYGDYYLISRMLNYISPVYEVINYKIMDFIRKIIDLDIDTKQEKVKEDITISDSNEEENIEQIVSESGVEEENIEQIEKLNMTDTPTLLDDELREILVKKETIKGNNAEGWVLKHFNKYIPDMYNCSTIPRACDLYSPSLKIRVEVKCNNIKEKPNANEKKFHRDCYEHTDDTNVFLYINLNPSSSSNSRIEINPLRIYININEFNESIIKLIVETAKYYDKKRVIGEVGKMDSNIVVNDVRMMLRELIYKEIPIVISDTAKIFRNSYNDSTNESLEQNSEEIEVKERVTGSNNRIKDHRSEVEQFFEENKPLFIKGLPKVMTYDMYLNWCKEHNFQQIRNVEFNAIFKYFCNDTRSRANGVSTRTWRIPIRK